MKPRHILKFGLPVKVGICERVHMFPTAAKAAKGLAAARLLGMVNPTVTVVEAGAVLFDVDLTTEPRQEFRGLSITEMEALMKRMFPGDVGMAAWWAKSAPAKRRSPVPDDYEGGCCKITAYQAFWERL